MEKGGIMAAVVLDCGGQDLVALITKEAATRLGLRVGENAYALVRATDVMIGR